MTSVSAANMMMRGGISVASRRSLTACSSARSFSVFPSRFYTENQLHEHAHQTTNINHQRHHLFSTRTRRRRRGGASLNNNQNLSPGQFLSNANDLLDKVESSVLKLKSSNEGIEMTRHPASSGDTSDADGSEFRQHLGQLTIKVPSIEGPYDGGSYTLTINADNNVAMQCLSGNFTYIYNTATSEWVGQEDGHSLLGMLTRDWIRQCHGVPDF
mmetsp:Transcript_10302/g.14805  ORF Transcript_10302/g.14805 Transcript_10302/m.14805 type:complete len:214 (+) Transcript_10302:32-673(+)